MSNEQKEKLQKYLLPAYRAISVMLMSITSIFLIKTYNMISDDHDRRIATDGVVLSHERRMTELEKLPPRIQKLESDLNVLNALEDKKRNTEVEDYLKSRP